MPDENLPDPDSNGMHAPASDARLQSLLESVCDQSVNAAELDELDALLTADKQIREYYLEYLSLHSSLQNHAWPAVQSCLSNSSGCDVDEIPERRIRLRRMMSILAIAATIAVATAGFYFRWSRVDVPIVASGSEDRRLDPESLPVARVTQLSDDILWQSPNESVALHSHLSAGYNLQLARGEMRLTYATGVELRLLGPTEFVIGPTGGRLLRGGLRAVVPEKGRGFTIETPNGKVIDLGTEFAVAVDDFGISEVNVFQGMVDMVPQIRGGAAQTMRLTKGEAVQWNSDTFVRIKADASAFGGSSPALSGKKLEDSRPIIDERFKDQVLSASKWSTFGNVMLKSGSSQLQDVGDSAEFPYLITTEEFAPSNGPLTVVADIRFIDIGSSSATTFAVLTRSANERDLGVNVGRRTMRTCVRCSFKSEPDTSSATIEVATKLDRFHELTNNQWRGFDQLHENVPYRLVIRDDGINVTFTVALRDDPSVSKTVTCRSLFRGKQNYVVLEGANGAVAVDRIQLFQDRVAKVIAQNASKTGDAADDNPKRMRLVNEQLASLAPPDGRLVVSDNFDGPAINESVWRTLDDVTLVNGRVRLGKPNSTGHINTYTSRPYLLTRERFSPAEGALTIIGTAEFDTNFLNEYGGSFAVMTRADNSRGKGRGWEYSILQRGIRENFWPAAWGEQHSLEIHEKPSATSLSLLASEGLEINPEAREYFFKVIDDGERVTLTIQDTHNAAIKKTASVHTSSTLKEGFIGFESCWGCPVWLDNVRIYKSDVAKRSGDK
jgi:hypothetical protein